MDSDKIRYILVAKTCSSCGDEIGVKTYSEKPIGEDIQKLEKELGGMFCIKTKIFQLVEDPFAEENCWEEIKEA